ncbi:hypothetical protein HELRODRAFT_183608 [Helobdella robusta]|uniref:Uncharacterized protein n=1 Tax=Helobdella robusta TaxID=6412 RepID=T1FJX4_HELRO|nr:hypothetical protein HELRODRAFT_183608 [Helobdella robusta]ESO10450.1 hypothetical protein HELRODRAFT_183608 [Helobdella robusta]
MIAFTIVLINFILKFISRKILNNALNCFLSLEREMSTRCLNPAWSHHFNQAYILPLANKSKQINSYRVNCHLPRYLESVLQSSCGVFPRWNLFFIFIAFTSRFFVDFACNVLVFENHDVRRMAEFLFSR